METYGWVDPKSDLYYALDQSHSLSEVIEAVHSDWSSSQKNSLRNFLANNGINYDTYRSSWMDYDEAFDSYSQSESLANTAADSYKSQGWTQDPGGTWHEPEDPTQTIGGTATDSNGYTWMVDTNGNKISLISGPSASTGITPYQQAQIDADNARLAWEKSRAAQEAAQWRAANTWTKYIDESGVWQRNQLGQVQYLGEVPQGVVQDMPTTWSGWGTSWQQNEQYNPTTQRMDVVYDKAPLGYEETLAQAQFANQPGNWYNTALLNRVLPASEQKYQTNVSEIVGRMVGARQGYGSQYDLQQGQAATGVTPGGWYDTGADSNAWKQGYPEAVGGTGTGEVGGYVTQVPSYQDFSNWNQTMRDQMGGWLNTGFADYQQAQDYWDKMNRLRAPSRYQGVSW